MKLPRFRRRPKPSKPTAQRLSIEDRLRAVAEARRGLADLQFQIANAADELRRITDASPECLLTLHAHLQVFIAQERWMRRIIEDAETALSGEARLH
jgi:hypothetical protein